MRKNLARVGLLIIGLFTFSNSYSIPKDSLKTKYAHGPFVFVGYSAIHSYEKPCNEKYCNLSQFEFQKRQFNVVSPELGFGYFFNYKWVFLRCDASITYAKKSIKYSIDYNSESFNDKTGGNSFNNRYFYNGGPPAGTLYYHIFDHYNLNANVLLININPIIGFKLAGGSGLYCGVKLNYIKYNYDGSLERNGKQYIVTATTFNNNWQYQLLQSENTIIKGNDIKNYSPYTLTGTGYISFGINHLLSVKKQTLFFNLQMDLDGALYYRKDLFTIRIGYFIKYWKKNKLS